MDGKFHGTGEVLVVMETHCFLTGAWVEMFLFLPEAMYQNQDFFSFSHLFSLQRLDGINPIALAAVSLFCLEILFGYLRLRRLQIEFGSI
ncbi:hypothetical protein AVEN_274242-1 [Araneus ventricosus]|uniref:Uncharacterized protein n=1 Tax=Araneus ventricosus TaxID=182803 RepID=A0A4Y2G3X8_ARAVE|nr:hypothetical protein AVEN_274242-1 [Araneus ventricosus]